MVYDRVGLFDLVRFGGGVILCKLSFREFDGNGFWIVGIVIFFWCFLIVCLNVWNGEEGI